VGNPAYPPPGDPFGVAIGQGGAFGDDIYVMDFEGASPYPPVLYRINDDGSQSVVASDPAVWTLIRKPTDIAIDSGGSFGGDLFAVDAISPPTIWRVTAAGDISTFYSSTAIPEPVAVAFGPGGPFGSDMYIFDDSNGEIYTVTPDGDVATFASGLPQNAPLSITPDMVFSNDGLTLFVGTGPSIFRIDAVEEMIEIYPQVQGEQGNNDWYVGDVSVTWDNPPPGASVIEGCQNSVIDTDTASIELVCRYRFDGALYSGSVLVKRDTTAPQPGCNIQPGATYPMTEGESLTVDCSGSTDNLSSVQASFDTNEDGVYGDAPVFNAIDESVTPCFIGVRLSDEAGNVTEFTTDIIVANTPPTVKIVQVDNQETAIGGDVTVYVDVEDPGVNDVLTAFVDWGDGTSLAGWVVPTMISALPAHTYNFPGAYTIEVTIFDDAGAASQSDTAQITVEDPLETIDFIEDEVVVAVGAGLYNHGQEKSLRVKLDNSTASITLQAFEAAAGQLRAFAYQGFAITDPDGILTPCFDLALQMADALDEWVPEPD